MPPMKNVRTLAERLKIIEEVEGNPGKTRVDIAKRLGIAPSTLNSIVAKKHEIRESIKKCGKSATKRKSSKESTFRELEEILHAWYQQARAANVPISGTKIREKALKIAEERGISNFSASNGWIDRFKVRYGLDYKKVTNDNASVERDTIATWMEKLPEIIEGYEPRDIYNADETGLFFDSLPHETVTLKDQSCHDGKNAKKRITVLLCTNSDGSDKMQPIVIGNSLKLRCFEDIKTLPAKYYVNKNAWMTTNIFMAFLRSLDSSMRVQGRKILLFVDQCAAHPLDISFLKNVRIVHYPLNSTRGLQPLDTGVIENFKQLYRKQLVHQILGLMESGRIVDRAAPRINMLQAMHYTVAAWHQVKTATIMNCFLTCGYNLSLEKLLTSAEESNDSFGDVWHLAAHESLDFAAYAQCDSELTTCGIDTDDTRSDTTKDSSKEDRDECNDEPIPRYSEALLAFEKIKAFFYSNNIDESIVKSIIELESSLFALKSRATRKPIKKLCLEKNILIL